ncbi:MAG: YbaB/EbfC family nucleoid-associated protein [Desulfobacterales bacterium]|jgi:hypothetical protein
MKLQDEMATKTVETTAGGGMVKVVANGKQQIVSIDIEKEVVDPEDIEMLQDLILAAVNEALTKSQEMVATEMSKLTGGLNIPGIM